MHSALLFLNFSNRELISLIAEVVVEDIPRIAVIAIAAVIGAVVGIAVIVLALLGLAVVVRGLIRRHGAPTSRRPPAAGRPGRW